MVLPVEVGDVRGPDSSEARNISHRPPWQMSKNITAQTPRYEVFRTSDRNPGSRREEIKGVAVLNNSRIVYLPDVAPEFRSGNALLARRKDSQDQKGETNLSFQPRFNLPLRNFS